MFPGVRRSTIDGRDAQADRRGGRRHLRVADLVADLAAGTAADTRTQRTRPVAAHDPDRARPPRGGPVPPRPRSRPAMPPERPPGHSRAPRPHASTGPHRPARPGRAGAPSPPRASRLDSALRMPAILLGGRSYPRRQPGVRRSGSLPRMRHRAGLPHPPRARPTHHPRRPPRPPSRPPAASPRPDARPRIVQDPVILGLTRHSRSKLGSRLFALFFVFVYVADPRPADLVAPAGLNRVLSEPRPTLASDTRGR